MATTPPPSEDAATRKPRVVATESFLRQNTLRPVHLLIALRGEGDVLGRGLLPALAAEISRDNFAAALTVLVRLGTPGVRLEGRYYLLGLPLQPYLSLGATTFFPATTVRASAGLVYPLGPVHLSADVAYERFLNPHISYFPDAVLLSLGAGWRLPVQPGF